MGILVCLTCGAYLGAFALATRREAPRARRPAAILALSILLLAAGLALLAVQGLVHPALGVVFANLVIAAATGLSVIGLRDFDGAPLRAGRYAAAALVLAAWAAFFTFVRPSAPARVLAMSLYLSVTYLDGTARCLRMAPGLGKPIPYTTAAIYLGLALFFALRSALAFPLGIPSIFAAGAMNLATMIVVVMGALGISIGFILLQNRRLQLELAASEGRYRRIYEDAVVGLFEGTPGGKALSANPALARILGYAGPEDLVASIEHLGRDIYAREEDREALLEILRRKGRVEGYETEFKKKDGGRIWASISVSYDPGAPEGPRLTGTLVDLSERHRAEEQLRAAFDEKALLLSELQHRVKNSMTMIGSLVSLESGRSEDPAVVEVLERLEGRIQAFSALYERLNRSASLRAVEARDYLGSIAAALAESHGAAQRGIALEVAVEAAELEPRRAVALGLVASELVTDAFKHAFPEGRGGRVQLRFARREGGFLLEVEDDGVGLPSGNPGREGLGMILIEMLARQLSGEFSARRLDPERGGSLFSLSFPG